ncbi:MAG: glutamate--cysteine ligase [Burkholderiales bacterium]
MEHLYKRLCALAPEVLRGILRGIEKESLRVRPDGMLATTPHPAGLGSALTHPRITTDFSESQLELITRPHADVNACLEELTEIHQVVYRHIGDELLWCASMPCRLPADDDIPLGRYGSSNIGRAKTVYRQGLAHRYGRRMQTICGIHYNFSLPEAAWPLLQHADQRGGEVRDYRNDAYFALIRNFRRHSWLLLYLLGASPAVCSSFVVGRAHRLRELKSGTLYLPGSTSLRMGPLGYQSEVQSSLAVSYNSLESYAHSLYDALTRPYPPYVTIGVRDGDDYLQLNTTLLQIENEFYGTIRPKRSIRRGERPLRALLERGVEYVEVRCVDLDPFSPVGITAETMRFLDVFLLHCLLSDSAPDTPEEIAVTSRNQHLVAENGRDPGLRLTRRDGEIPLAEWGGELLDECEPVAAALDEAHRASFHRDALAAAKAALADPAATPSARVLRQMKQSFDESYFRFALALSAEHRHTLLALPLADATLARYVRMAEESLAEQKRIEAQDAVSFEIFRQQYLSQALSGG